MAQPVLVKQPLHNSLRNALTAKGINTVEELFSLAKRGKPSTYSSTHLINYHLTSSL
jgi:hypothetical protein